MPHGTPCPGSRKALSNMTFTLVRCWAPPRSALVGPLLLLLLPPLSHTRLELELVTPFLWQFIIRETYWKDNAARTHVVGTGNCVPAECQTQVAITFPPGALKSLTPGFSSPALCFLYDQTETYCSWWADTYGGCPYSSCKMHLALDWNKELSINRQGLFVGDGKGNFRINIPDPWDPRWASGVEGKLYSWRCSAKPSGTIHIHRGYIRIAPKGLQDLQEPSLVILESEQSLNDHLPPKEYLGASLSPDPFTWLKTVQEAATLLNVPGFTNLSKCFLCAPLQRPLLAAVPLTHFTPSNSTKACPPPLKEIPLYLPPNTSDNGTHPICYHTTFTSFRCNATRGITGIVRAPPGTFFWCNGTLYKCINGSSPAPCIPATVVPQLMLYGQAELEDLVSLFPEPPRHEKRAVFLPGVSLASSFVAAGLGSGALGPSVVTAQDFEDRLRLAVETSSASTALLQRQLTSGAHVALQNRRARGLLTAEKGGACLFLQEECCYYINESGLVEQNVQTLNKLGENLWRYKQTT
ncbi:endogenous retrovirus group FC1 Env polyprotein [Echinops telfairi]|uniref:Endogenous retrovirus group FC1 Env polyprotein n=1 Tax=Echinops telfairi TaxID=9371 RepID=A0AC55D712_ECHTE|nr:endogenous retrovirus group FC1 Env polyprotein [Echinops telfairi]